jgi:hypothetical protein
MKRRRAVKKKENPKGVEITRTDMNFSVSFSIRIVKTGDAGDVAISTEDEAVDMTDSLCFVRAWKMIMLINTN